MPKNPRDPNFVVVKESSTFIIIRDVGPWDKHRTITNGAEECVAELFADYRLGSRRVGYYDSEGQLDELVHDGCGNFIRFSPGFKAGSAEARAVVDAFAAHSPILRFPPEPLPGPVTWDESKMTDEQKATLLPRIK